MFLELTIYTMYLNTQKTVTTDEIHKWMEEPEKTTYDIEYIDKEFITNKSRDSLHNYISFCMKEKIYDEAIKYLIYLKNDNITKIELIDIQLMLADAYTKTSEYIKADAIYNSFLLDNEDYLELDVILYKAAKNLLKLYEPTLLKQITSIISNTYSRDISYMEKILYYLEKLIVKTNDIKYLDYARKNIDIVNTTIIKHDLYVAAYYLNTHQYRAALNRVLKAETRNKGILTKDTLDLKEKILINIKDQHNITSKLLICKNYNFLKTIDTTKDKID